VKVIYLPAWLYINSKILKNGNFVVESTMVGQPFFLCKNKAIMVKLLKITKIIRAVINPPLNLELHIQKLKKVT